MRNMIGFFLLIFLLFGILSCNFNKPGSRGVLSIDDMKIVMWDVLMVDEFANNFLLKDSLLNIPKESGIMYQKVFVLHKTTGKQFYNSFDFYRKHPVYLKVLIDSLNAYGTREKERGFLRTRQTKPAEIKYR